MQVTTFNIEGLKLFTLDCHRDERGFFVERFQKERFQKFGLKEDFIQDNFSRSEKGVLRGLHCQFQPAQGKLVTVLNGKILDIAVDVRHQSPTFGQYQAVELSGDNPQWFWLPPGFAHGFCVLGEQTADVMYKVNALWGPQGEIGIRWDDPELALPWPQGDFVISKKDAVLMSFAEYKRNPVF